MLFSLALLLLNLTIESASAQQAMQVMTIYQPDGKVYRDTGHATDLDNCRRLLAKSYELAQAQKLEVQRGGTAPHDWIRYTDPVTRLSIKQECSTDAVFDPAPDPPLSPGSPLLQALPCPTLTGKSRIYLVAGQSQAGNHGEGRYTAGPAVYAYHQGKCYQASDPLPGASGTDASPWPRLGDKLVKSHVADFVVFADIAQGGTKAAVWAPGGSLNPVLRSTIRDMIDHGLTPTTMLWVQGEADVATPGETYRSQVRSMYQSAREAGLNSPIFIAKTTICVSRGKTQTKQEIDAVLNSAPLGIITQENYFYQMRETIDELIEQADHALFRRGPDLDSIGPEFRYDGCHMSRRGLDTHADLWLRILSQ